MSHVYARTTAHIAPAVMTQAGELWDADDPVVREHPEAFTADASAFVRRSGPADRPTPEATSEVTSAAPGEKRAVTRPSGGRTTDKA